MPKQHVTRETGMGEILESPRHNYFAKFDNPQILHAPGRGGKKTKKNRNTTETKTVTIRRPEVMTIRRPEEMTREEKKKEEIGLTHQDPIQTAAARDIKNEIITQ